MNTNIVRGTAEGLSMKMFLLTFSGNATYVISILLRALRPNHVASDFILGKLPWIINASTCMVEDVIILCQCFYYARKENENTTSDSPNGNPQTASPNSLENAIFESIDGSSTDESKYASYVYKKLQDNDL